jgi:hypothetical protein
VGRGTDKLRFGTFALAFFTRPVTYAVCLHRLKGTKQTRASLSDGLTPFQPSAPAAGFFRSLMAANLSFRSLFFKSTAQKIHALMQREGFLAA